MTRTRRNLLQLSAGAVVSVLARPALAVEPDGDHARWLADFADGREIRNGGLVLDMPASVEDGAFVMVSVVATAGTAASLTILAPKNPVPVVATFTLSPMSANGRVTTRIRLAESQTVLAAARLTDGSVVHAAQAVSVAIGGCGG